MAVVAVFINTAASAGCAEVSCGADESLPGGAEVAEIARPGRGIHAGSARLGSDTAGMVTDGSHPVRP